MSTPNPQDQTAAIHEAIFGGQKITAIKLYREQNKVGLAEAKAAVEKMEAQLRLASPERFTARTPSKGCLALVVVFVLVGTAVWKLVR